MSERSTFVSVADQIVTFQKNTMSLLTGLVKVVSTTDNNITVDLTNNETGDEFTTTLPSIGFFNSELSRISQNIKTLSSVDQRGAIIRPSNNTYKRIIVADLNREPSPITALSTVTTFHSERNWFFDSLLNPGVFVKFDLTGKIEDNVRKIISRRYIIEIDKDEFNVPTAEGTESANSFNQNFKGRTDITIDEIETWINDNVGVVENKNGSRINYDEQTFDLEPNRIQYDGLFTILGTYEDITNRKLYYIFDTLDYFNLDTGEKKTLVIGDEVIVNTDLSTTRLVVVEINNQASEIWIVLNTIEGYETIPVGVRGGLKYYSPVVSTKAVDISVGFDEYNVIFAKAYNTDNFLVSRNWSTGSAFYTNDLTLNASDGAGATGQSLTDYYIKNINDYGEIIKDQATKVIPLSFGLKPNAPVLNPDNFKVLQINKHLTDTPDLERLRKLHTKSTALVSKIDALNKSITTKRTELNTKKYPSPADRTKSEKELSKKIQDKESASQDLAAVVNDINSIQTSNSKTAAAYQARGYFTLPDPVSDGKTRPQEVIQFIIQYRYTSADGKTNNTESFKVTAPNDTIINATYSEWNEYTTEIRERYFDAIQQKWLWKTEDLTNADQPNINGIGIDIHPREQVEIRVKSLSEVGWPDAALESDWSNTMTIAFDPTLINRDNRDEEIAATAALNNLRLQVQQDLSQRGIDQHLADQITVSGTYYAHISDNIGVRDASGRTISLNDRLNQIATGSNVAPNQPFVLQEPWVNFGGAEASATYYLHEQEVKLSGKIRVENRFFDDEDNQFESRYPADEAAGNAKYTNIASLPVGYRPQGNVQFLISSYSPTAPFRVGLIQITPDGLIRLVDGNTGYVSLDGISFRIAQDTSVAATSTTLKNFKIR